MKKGEILPIYIVSTHERSRTLADPLVCKGRGVLGTLGT